MPRGASEQRERQQGAEQKLRFCRPDLSPDLDSDFCFKHKRFFLLEKNVSECEISLMFFVDVLYNRLHYKKCKFSSD